MAMYYQNSSETQADNLHTFPLMNPNYIPYSTTHFFNPATSSAAVIPHAPLHNGIPLSHDPTRPLPPPALAHQHNMWGLLDQPQTLSLRLSGDHEFRSSSIGVMSPKNCSSPSETNSLIMGSKYLKVVQELLDEVVKVEAPPSMTAARWEKVKWVRERDEGMGIRCEMTTTQRQEIQMKKSKLSSMLDEVEQRCRQYHQQMQLVVSAFEQAAGSGSSKPYTHLALKTILKQFKCLKSTISSQIKGLNKSLGDDESLEGSTSRLKFVDIQLRQQRSLMMQNNAWRPQRGLPEKAVSVLRTWLFEHFLHPYPKDLDKQMLAKQTGLTRSQVSNWFINARVRLWKPMVEEMYLEETNTRPETIKPEPDPKPPTTTPPQLAAAHLINSGNQMSPKKPRNAAVNENPSGAAASRYGMSELDQQLAAAGFGGSGFSLSLGLHPAESSKFLSHVGGDGGYGIVDFQRKVFPAEVFPDFVS